MLTVDAVATLHTPEIVGMRGQWYQDFLADKIGARADVVTGVGLDDYVALMDDAGIGISLLAATKEGSSDHRISFHTPVEMVVDAVDRHPTRFRGLAGIDPTQGMRGVRDLETAVTGYGFVGAHLYPHWFELEPDHARYYPFYAKCAELGVPVQIQVGHCLRYSEDRPLRSVGFPRCLDRIACDFPELVLVGIHVGWPWTEEMISVAWKHPNVYVCGDARAPRYWPESFVRFADSWGRSKVMFGTDFPVIEPKRAVDEVGALDLREESRQALLHENARRVYGLPSP
jgi:predicted TIM-barrel fold metal-dependent hydrolase